MKLLYRGLMDIIFDIILSSIDYVRILEQQHAIVIESQYESYIYYFPVTRKPFLTIHSTWFQELFGWLPNLKSNGFSIFPVISSCHGRMINTFFSKWMSGVSYRFVFFSILFLRKMLRNVRTLFFRSPRELTIPKYLVRNTLRFQLSTKILGRLQIVLGFFSFRILVRGKN